MEQGQDNADAMVVQHKDIAIKFIDLYWQQTAPYGSGLPNTTTSVLIQKNGVQAAVVTAISAFRKKEPGSDPDHSQTISRLRRLIQPPGGGLRMPPPGGPPIPGGERPPIPGPGLGRASLPSPLMQRCM